MNISSLCMFSPIYTDVFGILIYYNVFIALKAMSKNSLKMVYHS